MIKKALKTTTLIYESNKTNRTNNIKTKNYTNIYTNRKNESNTQRTNTSNLLSKSSKQEKELFEKLFYNKDVKKNTDVPVMIEMMWTSDSAILLRI